jgi:hypothetical protein
MPRPTPDYRGRAVLAAARTHEVSPGTHAYETAFFNLLKGVKGVLPEIQEAFEIYSVETYRHVLDASILGKASNDQIADCLEIASSTINVYRHLFCDRGVFPHALVIPDYIKQLDIQDRFKEWYALANTRGGEALLRRFKIGKPTPPSPDEVLQTLLADQYDRALTHRGEQITSDIAMASFKWGQEAAKTANLMIHRGESNPEKGAQAMRLALRTTDQTQTAEEAGIDPEELVTE